MKKKLLVILLVFLAALWGYGQDKPVITVMDFAVDGVSSAEMRSIISVLSSALFKTNAFIVIDVSQRETVLKEMEFSMSGCTDESCYLEIGKLLSAEGIVTGSIGKVGSRYILSTKLLKTETAQTLSTSDGMFKDLDELMDGLATIAEELSSPYMAEAPTAEKPARERKPLPKLDLEKVNLPALASLAGGLAGLGTGIYFLAVSLPYVADFLEAKKLYETSQSDDPDEITGLYNALEAARIAAAENNAERNFLLGSSLSLVGTGLGVLSVILFTRPPGEEEPPQTAFIPEFRPGAVCFHIRF